MSPAVGNTATSSQRELYEREGYLVLRGLFEPAALTQAQEETQALLSRHELMAKNNLRVRWTHHVDTDVPIFELFDPIVDIAPRCRELALAPRLTAVLAGLLGDEVCLFKDKLIYKPPGAAGYPLHQDYISWPDFPVSFTTVVVALDRGDAQSGAIEVFPGGHGKGYLSERSGRFTMSCEGWWRPAERPRVRTCCPCCCRPATRTASPCRSSWCWTRRSPCSSPGMRPRLTC